MNKNAKHESFISPEPTTYNEPLKNIIIGECEILMFLVGTITTSAELGSNLATIFYYITLQSSNKVFNFPLKFTTLKCLNSSGSLLYNFIMSLK